MRWKSKAFEVGDLLAVGLVAVGLCGHPGCTSEADGSSGAAPATAQATPAPTPEPAAPAPEETSPVDQMMEIDDAQGAFALARPSMHDTQDDYSPGMLLFALWASEKLVWSDVHVERDETSFKLVQKDSDAARGKRMCYSGDIVQIAKQDIGARPIFEGLLRTRRWDIIHFIAAGSTGDLVEDSRARFCGFVTGRYSYSNAGGGTTHAVQMVGMFKLPENTAP